MNIGKGFVRHFVALRHLLDEVEAAGKRLRQTDSLFSARLMFAGYQTCRCHECKSQVKPRSTASSLFWIS
jgi:hypothetical protein